MPKHFKPSEFACKCGCGLLPSAEIMDKAERIRSEWGKPLACNSGARCMSHTLQLRAQGIPAALHSAHMEGIAVDLAPTDLASLLVFQDFCVKGLMRWNLYMEDPLYTTMWVHLDLRKRANRIFKP